MSSCERNNKLNSHYESDLNSVQAREMTNSETSKMVIVKNQPPPVPHRCRITIKQEGYTNRNQFQVPAPEPRRRLNVSELRNQFSIIEENDRSPSRHASTQEHNKLDQADKGFKFVNEKVHEITQVDDYEEVDYDADECYQDEDEDGYDDNCLQGQEQDQTSVDLVNLSRRSMLPLHELIAYYQYIQHGSSSITSDQEPEESSSTAVSRQSSSASQQTAKFSPLGALTQLNLYDLPSRQRVENQSALKSDELDHKRTSADTLQFEEEEVHLPKIQIHEVATTTEHNFNDEKGGQDEEISPDLARTSQQAKSNKHVDKRRIRANVVLELINSERDFVKHLKDVVEGYLYPARKHPEIFTGERINTIFANIEQLYEFQRKFLESLETCINWKDLAASEVGKCFLNYEKGFSVYHYYCNNHPNATSELQELYTKPRFVKFFEACRVLQNMIDISLDGFLLTPIQKICKYPLQLTELLKNTDETHADYKYVLSALETMRNCANLANERKRRIEALADVMLFQEKFDNWFGPKLNDTSSILVHSGEVAKMNTSNTWSHGVQLYLFDHLLLFSKKDILKRSGLMLKGKINMDSVTEISDADEYKPKRSFKLYCSDQQKWFVFITRGEKEKDEWIQAFERERNLVESDESEGFQITDREIGIARRALQHRKHSRSARYRHKHNRPDTAIVDQIDLDDANMIMNRTLSLPSCIHPSHVMNFVEDSKVVSSGKPAKGTQHSPGSRSPGGQSTMQHQMAITDDQHPDQKLSQASGVNWFKKMGSKKLAKSQVYTISSDNQHATESGGVINKLVSSSVSPLAPKINTSPSQPAQLTSAQIITSDKAAIKYEELEKRHREHMSSEEQARLYRLNNDLPPPPSMFGVSSPSGASSGGMSRSSAPLSASWQAGNLSSGCQQTTTRDKPDQRVDPYLTQRIQSSRLNDDDDNDNEAHLLRRSNLDASSFEGTLMLSSGRVVRVREDAV